MSNQFWIQVHPTTNAIVAKLRTNGRVKPINPPFRIIQVDEDFFLRLFYNATNRRGQYVPNQDYEFDETQVKEKDRTGKDDVIIVERGMIMREKLS